MRRWSWLWKPALLGGAAVAGIQLGLVVPGMLQAPPQPENQTVALLSPARVRIPTDAAPGSDYQSIVRIRNMSSQPINVAGADFDCACMSAAEFPILLAPGAVGEVPIDIHLPDRIADFRQRVELFYDRVPQSHTVTFVGTLPAK